MNLEVGVNGRYGKFPRFTNPARYHNGAVEAYKRGSAEDALEIIEEGLSFYPYDVDLLADAVQWAPVSPGPSIGSDIAIRYAEDYFKVLIDREFMWTWRAYDFSIDYLVDKKTAISDAEDALKALSDAERLSKRYIEMFPNDERSHAARVKVLKALKKHDEAEKLLHDVVFGGDGTKAISAPSCCVDYIEVLFEKGQYAIAAKVARKAIIGDAQTQPTVNLGYLLYLEALALDALFLEKKVDNDVDLKDSGASGAVTRIYKLYTMAKDLIADRASYVSAIDARIRMLECYTGIKCEYNDDDAVDLDDILAKLDALSSDDDEEEEEGDSYYFE